MKNRNKRLFIAMVFAMMSVNSLSQILCIVNIGSELMSFTISPEKQNSIWTDFFIPVFMISLGIGMIGIWTVDIVSGKFSNLGNFFKWRNAGGEYMWTHISAEYITGMALITGGTGLFSGKNWAVSASLIALGLLIYTSLNSLGWAFAEKERRAYVVPMALGFVGGVLSIVCLL